MQIFEIFEKKRLGHIPNEMIIYLKYSCVPRPVQLSTNKQNKPIT